MITVALLQHRPPEIIYFICGVWLVIVLASLPDVIKTLTTSGALAEYMRQPDNVYLKEKQDRK